MQRELESCARAFDDALGQPTRLFRPPFGGRRPGSLRVARRLGLTTVMWSVSARDWTLPSAAAIEQQVLRHLRGGDVILMHDGSHRGMGADRSATVAATDRLIPRLRDQGYRFVTIGEMLAGQGAPAPKP